MSQLFESFTRAQLAIHGEKFVEAEKILTDVINEASQTSDEFNTNLTKLCLEQRIHINYQLRFYQNVLNDINKLQSMDENIYKNERIMHMKWESMHEVEYTIMLNDFIKMNKPVNNLKSFLKKCKFHRRK